MDSHRPPRERSAFGGLPQQFLGYIVVGGIAFLIDFATLFVLTDFFRLYYLASASAGFLLGLMANYLLCIRWVFNYRAVGDRQFHEFSLFAVIGIVGLLINNSLLYGLTDGLGLHYLLAKVLVAGMILIFNFSARRYLLFSDTNYSRWFRKQVSKLSNP